MLTATPRQIRGDAEGAVPSPDGNSVAFRNSQGVWVMDASGENTHQLLATELQASFGKVQWSPDGDRVAVLVRRIGDSVGTVEAVSRTGGDRTVLLRSENLRTFAWLPDGSFIAATQEPGANKSARLHKFLASGEEISFDIAAETAIADISATADSRQFALVRGSEQSDVYLAGLSRNPGLTDQRRLTLDDRDDEPSGWQADGKAVLFHSTRNGSQDVFRQGVNSAAPELVVGGPDLQYGAQMSPDGRKVLYWSQSPEAREKRLMAIPVEGGSATTIFDAPAGARFYCGTAVPQCLLVTSDGAKLRVERFSGAGPKELLHEIQLGADPEPDMHVAAIPQPARIAYAIKDKIFIWSAAGTRELSPSLPGKITGLAILGPELLVTTSSSRENLLLSVNEKALRRMGQLERASFTPIPAPDQRTVAFKIVTTSSNAWLIETR